MTDYILRSKKESWFLDTFTPHHWTALGDTIWYPKDVNVTWPERHQATIEHELIHLQRQRESWMPLWLWILAYCLFPVPIGFAWFRWREERIAYDNGIAKRHHSVLHAVRSINGYFWPWPTPLMRAWFDKQYLIRMKRKMNGK